MKTSKSDASVLIRSVLTALADSLLVIVALCAMSAVLMGAEKLPESSMRYCAWGICALGAAAGCLTGQALAGRARLPVSLITAALLLAVMAAGRALLGGADGGAWHCALIVSLVAVMTALAMAGRRNRRR